MYRSASISVHFLLSVSCLLLTGCFEELPVYEKPDIFALSVCFTTDSVINMEELAEGGPRPVIAVDLTNEYDEDHQLVLNPPYTTQVRVVVSHLRNPHLAHELISETVYESFADRLEPNQTKRIVKFDFPFYTDEGHPWNSYKYTSYKHDLILRGTVTIPEVGSNGVEIRIAQKQISLIYFTP